MTQSLEKFFEEFDRKTVWSYTEDGMKALKELEVRKAITQAYKLGQQSVVEVVEGVDWRHVYVLDLSTCGEEQALKEKKFKFVGDKIFNQLKIK